jgi:4-diphosphocytidyl-2-C-methyl-D-erythritol kinase
VIVSALAPAKINLGLEILRRRTDGYHEIRTILAAFSLFDRLELQRGEEFQLQVDRSELEGEDNLVAAAVRLLQRDVRAIIPNVALRKRIPTAAGLGGASSDAAATLSAVDRLYGLALTDQRLHALAASLGSDVPFFLSGGVALASGRGDCLTPLRPPSALFAVVVAPKIEIPAKTATLYGALTCADYSDGTRIERSVRLGRSGWISNAELLGNAFERPLYDLVPALAELPKLMRRHGATTVGLSGAGPSHYSLETDPARARTLAAGLREELRDRAAVFVGRVLDHGVLVAEHESVPESHEWFAQFDDN